MNRLKARTKKILKSNYFLPFVVIEFIITTIFLSEVLKEIIDEKIIKDRIIGSIVVFFIIQGIVLLLFLVCRKFFKFEELMDDSNEKK